MCPNSARNFFDGFFALAYLAAVDHDIVFVGDAINADGTESKILETWTASFPSRFPAPPLEKGMLVPLEHRLGFHQLGRRLPSGSYNEPHWDVRW